MASEIGRCSGSCWVVSCVGKRPNRLEDIVRARMGCLAVLHPPDSGSGFAQVSFAIYDPAAKPCRSKISIHCKPMSD